MIPYYDDGTCVIYHGDCREILPSVVCDAVITDPPYGLGRSDDYGSIAVKDEWRNRGNRKNGYYDAGKEWAPMLGDDMPFDPAHVLAMNVPTVIFGADHFASRLPDSRGWLIWDKRDGLGTNMFADAELAWTNKAITTRIFRHKWLGYMRASEVGVHLHPTQKPVALMRWVIDLVTVAGDTVCDPYMGSGPVLRAAKDLGRRAIGIEIEERYCEIAARRLAQEVFDFGAAGGGAS